MSHIRDGHETDVAQTLHEAVRNGSQVVVYLSSGHTFIGTVAAIDQSSARLRMPSAARVTIFFAVVAAIESQEQP